VPPYLVFSFALADTCAGWYSIDDGVMGGVSYSSVRCADGELVFSGVVSLANNGGFASIRSPAAHYDLSGATGVALRVKGDGKTYKLNLKPDAGFDGVQYQASFVTSGQWEEARLPWSAFEPRFRGRLVHDAPPLDPSRIASFGLLISDKQSGPYRLEVERIEGYR
jgi:monofunctional biosynthetic peptidoglycan transglycosylase